MIVAEARRLERLVADLLDLARLRADDFRLDPRAGRPDRAREGRGRGVGRPLCRRRRPCRRVSRPRG